MTKRCARFRGSRSFIRSGEWPSRCWTQQSLSEAEPNLRAGLVGGLRVPGDSVIYPPCAAQFLVDRAVARGAHVFLGKAVEEITADGVRLRDGSTISAGLMVNAAGSWSPGLSARVNVKKRKGHLVITDRYPQFLRHQLVELGYLKSAHSLTSDRSLSTFSRERRDSC